MWKLLKKELKELLSWGTIISMIFLATFYGILGKSFENMEKAAMKKPTIIVIGNSKYLENTKKLTNLIFAKDKKSALELAKNNHAGLIVELPKNMDALIEKQIPTKIKVIWLVKGLGMFDMVESGSVGIFTQSLKDYIITKMLQKENINPVFIKSPILEQHDTLIKGKEFKGVQPFNIVNSMGSLTIFLPLIIMMIINISGSSLIMAFAMEKENKTLETLLTMPIKREHIILSKIIASMISGVIMVGIFGVGFMMYMKGFKTLSSAQSQLSLTLGENIIIILSLLLSLFAGLLLCLVLSVLAKDQKKAQMLAFPISMLALIPMLVSMFKDLDTLPTIFKIILILIPFTHPMNAPKLLLFDQIQMVYFGIIYNLVFSSIMLLISWKIFKSDIVILGFSKRKSKRKKSYFF